MLYLVTYDLSQPRQNYDELYEAIKQCSTKWWHYLDSTWLIVTNMEIPECVERIHPVMDTDDKLLVIDVTNANRNGWLPKKAWDWIRENIDGK